MLNHRPIYLMALFALACSALACSAPTGSSSDDASPPSERVHTLASPFATAAYIDARSFLTSDADIDRWYDLTFALRQDFDDICGDTFCEGDYSNYESLGFSCSVNRATGTLAECAWVFAASTEEIDPMTGGIDVQVQSWQCAIPLAPNTSVSEFLEMMSSSEERPLFTALPSTSQTTYDGLIDCL